MSARFSTTMLYDNGGASFKPGKGEGGSATSLFPFRRRAGKSGHLALKTAGSMYSKAICQIIRTKGRESNRPVKEARFTSIRGFSGKKLALDHTEKARALR